jgi:hypothetical protein
MTAKNKVRYPSPPKPRLWMENSASFVKILERRAVKGPPEAAAEGAKRTLYCSYLSYKKQFLVFF